MNNLHKLNENTKLILDDLPAMYAWYDVNLVLHWANKAFLKQFGKSLHDMAGQTNRQIWAQANIDHIEWSVEKAKISGRNEESQITLKNGRFLLVHATPVVNSKGELIALTEFIQEVHPLQDGSLNHSTKITLRENEKTLWDIIEFLPDATLVIDKQGTVIAWNRAIEVMTGISKKDMLGKGDHAYAIPFYGEKRPIIIDLIFSENKEIEKKYSEVKQLGETLVAEVFIPTLNKGMGAYLWVIASPLYNNNGELVGAIESIRDISERKKTEDQLMSALSEKDALLRELYHRTKNNMQMISSLLALQSDYVDDQRVLDVFKDMDNRIRSMALVHQRLYQLHNLSEIELSEYLHEMAGLLLQSYNTRPDQITVDVQAEPVTVLIDTAIPCGLIINELVSNALKYAFPNNMKGKINISLSKPTENELMLSVSDTGVGILPDLDLREKGKLGMQIVYALGEQQLGGTVTYQIDPGFSCQVRFPLPTTP